MAKTVSGAKIRAHILRTLHLHPSTVIQKTARRFGAPRSEVERHVNQLVDEGKLKWSGRVPVLVGKDYFFENPIAARDKEHEVYLEQIDPVVSGLPDNIQRICYYGFTEIYNNAVDHSGGSKIQVRLSIFDYSIEFVIYDDGVGIFKKIRDAFGLEDHRQVFSALARGGLTTDPERHSGQGIFFTSRAFDNFWVMSEKLSFHHNVESDWLLDYGMHVNGTSVIMCISKNSNTNLKNLFDTFTVDKEEQTVFKTHAPLRLSSLACGDFVSRSQAKRVLARFDKYEEIFLDFEGVDFIGQAFADEIFRVFASMNPGVKLIYINCNSDVGSMIEFARRTVPSGPN